MLTVIATLSFLLVLGLAAAVMLEVLGDNRAKVLAALKGQWRVAEVPGLRPVTVRFSPRPAPVRRAMRAAPRLRVAA